MLSRLYYLLFIFLLTFSIAGCKKKPTYPDTPSIEFLSLERYIITNSNFTSVKTDSIVFTIQFKDGDGDLGLTPNEPPFTEFDIKLDNFGDTIKYNGTPPFSCDNYIIDEYFDTILVTRNIHFYNYFIDLLVKQSNGTYLPYEFIQCGSLKGRFPPLAPTNYRGPLEGNLSFTLINQLKPLLENKIIKFRLYIEDKAYHKSNIIESADLLLNY